MSLRIVNYEKKKKEKIKGKTMKDKSLLREKKKKKSRLVKRRIERTPFPSSSYTYTRTPPGLGPLLFCPVHDDEWKGINVMNEPFGHDPIKSSNSTTALPCTHTPWRVL